MKRIALKILLGMLTAGAVGGGGYFLWRQHKHKKDARTDDGPLEVEYILYHADKLEKPNVVVRDDGDVNKGETDIPKEKFAKRVSAYMQTEGEKENFEAYISSMESPEEDDPDDEYDEDDYDIRGRSNKGQPFQITAGEFCNSRTYYDKVSLNYFAGDEVVADDRDEVVEDASRILGDIQEAFDDPRSPSVVYIRNEELEVDYEISLVDGRYSKEVLHLDEEG